MTKEDYVSFKLALLLEEKGFDERCYKKYSSNGDLFDAEEFTYGHKAPTQSQVMKWLREVHNMFVNIDYSHICEQFKYTICLKDSSLREHGAHVDYIFNSYEEACEAAIKYVLENLI